MDTDDRLCDLDARVLRAGAPRGRSASLIAEHAGWLPDITLSTPAPPASHGLVAHAGTAPPTGGEEPATATPRRVRLMTSRDDAHHRVAGQFPVSLALDCRSPVAGASAGSPEDDRVRRAGQNARQCTAELRPNPAAARLILIPQPIDKLIGAVGSGPLDARALDLQRVGPQVLPDEHSGSTSGLHRGGEALDIFLGQTAPPVGPRSPAALLARRRRKAPSPRRHRPRSW